MNSYRDESLRNLRSNTTFHAAINAHGQYEGHRFVVRLSPLIHEKLSSLPSGVNISDDITFEQKEAFSTYLHEVIHWWQHIGSTVGLLISLSHPAQTHANLGPLRKLLEAVGPIKSIRQFAESKPGQITVDTPAGLANIIINNQFDIESHRFLITNPERAHERVHNKLFESIGHAYSISQISALTILSSTFDRNIEKLPDPKIWSDELNKLRARQEPGFVYGSPIELSPIGAHAIFEGQARVSQLQYLYFSSNGKIDWDYAIHDKPIYRKAFEVFLELSGLSFPSTVDHPIVGLFLLICDISMNPGEGFPFPVNCPKSFIRDNDIGTRFIFLCGAVCLFCPEVATAIKSYSASEYEEVSEKLCSALKIISPLSICRIIKEFVEEGSEFRECLYLHDMGKVSDFNTPIQVMFGQFASYARDKLRFPEILCWPGASMAGRAIKEESVDVFSRQSPLFTDSADSSMISPVVRNGLNESDVFETFEKFYSGQALYDMTRQWITESGKFEYDYRWLQPNGSAENVRSWANSIFERTFSVKVDDFRLL